VLQQHDGLADPGSRRWRSSRRKKLLLARLAAEGQRVTRALRAGGVKVKKV
jgi:hypothetical protein